LSNAPNANHPETTAATPRHATAQKVAAKQRLVHACNFRSAGRMSNEDARALTAIHETFALQLAGTLDNYIGTGLEVKLDTIDQLPIREHIAGIPSMSYILPFSANMVVLEFDFELVFPIIELLMGGTSVDAGEPRELSEIEDEVMQGVMTVIVRQAEAVWRVPGLSLTPSARLKPALMHQCFAPNEKVTVLKFVVEIAGVSGSFRLVYSAEFLGALMAQIKRDQPQKKSRVWSFPMPPLRERILDCEFVVSSELPGLRVAVRDLIALRPGSVLKLRAPIRNPGVLTAGGRAMFEAVPVRNGSQRAAQLGRRIQSTDWKRR
jgi:flagellar motor switch protein FliM